MARTVIRSERRSTFSIHVDIMSNPLTLQVDISSATSNSIAVLGTLKPLLKALSADNVNPLAVLQLEAIGACFQINGDVAAKVPDLLVRSESIRLQRVSQWVGWMAGDTAAEMSKSAGGRASALLSLALIEMFGEESTGLLLHRLSSEILHVDNMQSGITQLGQVASTLSRKLTAIGFGSHLAFHVTRIRETYFNSNRWIPNMLLDSLTVDTMVDLLRGLHRALHDETLILSIEGCQGMGYIVAFIMALCPEDTLVTVEDEIIYEGKRKSVLISVKAETATKFGVETVIHGPGIRTDVRIVAVERKLGLLTRSFNLKWQGCMADMLDLAFLSVGARATPELYHGCIQIIAAIAFQFSGSELFSGVVNYQDGTSSLPYDGLQSLLGPYAMSRVQTTLSDLFRTQASISLDSCETAFGNIQKTIKGLVPSSTCTCGRCFNGKWWFAKINSKQTKCKFREVLNIVSSVICKGVAALFVKAEPIACLQLSASYVPSDTLMFAIYKRFNAQNTRDRPIFGNTALHRAILDLVACPQAPDNRLPLGESSGSFSIFPSTIQNPEFDPNHSIEYFLVDGKFHDGQSYYDALLSESCSKRRVANAGLTQSHPGPLTPSGVGTHSSLTLSARGVVGGLEVRTVIQVAGTRVHLDFLSLHLAYISVTYASGCVHNRRDPLDKKHRDVVTTSVAHPVASQRRLSLTLTHRNPEAQFLSCVPNIRILFQGGSCLNCVVDLAKKDDFQLIISS